MPACSTCRTQVRTVQRNMSPVLTTVCLLPWQRGPSLPLCATELFLVAIAIRVCFKLCIPFPPPPSPAHLHTLMTLATAVYYCDTNARRRRNKLSIYNNQGNNSNSLWEQMSVFTFLVCVLFHIRNEKNKQGKIYTANLWLLFSYSIKFLRLLAILPRLHNQFKHSLCLSK